ncbi:phytanoyl-CoA dioxygenase family protein, partial [Myxococcota bacterium]|nr:phytanoyl-CoA dioxygenase family protein [Myxococcota bacterium]
DPARPECILAVNWALTDFRVENGATRIVPGSHLWPEDRRPEKDEIAQAEMPKGSLLFWTGKALHGLGASRVEEPRTGVIVTFVVNWMTQEENQYLTVPPEVARELPERAQQLLGYRCSATLGWSVGRDQDNMLQPGKSGNI